MVLSIMIIRMKLLISGLLPPLNLRQLKHVLIRYVVYSDVISSGILRCIAPYRFLEGHHLPLELFILILDHVYGLLFNRLFLETHVLLLEIVKFAVDILG